MLSFRIVFRTRKNVWKKDIISYCISYVGEFYHFVLYFAVFQMVFSGAKDHFDLGIPAPPEWRYLF